MIVNLIDELPKKMSVLVISKQILRCSTSVGSNYRAACRAKSTKDFIAKLGIAEEEGDETIFWLEMILEAKLASQEQIKPIKQEASEILAIIVSSIKTAKNNLTK